MIVLLPGEHDLGSSVVSSRDVSGHLRVYRGEKERESARSFRTLHDVGPVEYWEETEEVWREWLTLNSSETEITDLSERGKENEPSARARKAGTRQKGGGYKETYLEITVLVDEDVGRLEISVDNSSRVNVLETSLFCSKRGRV